MKRKCSRTLELPFDGSTSAAPQSTPFAAGLDREPWTPHVYQRTAVEWLVKHSGAALFLDPGLGKTSVALRAFQALRSARKLRRALVVAPLKPCFLVWERRPGSETHRWTSFDDLRITILHGSKKADRLDDDAEVFVINYDGLPWLLGPPSEFNKRRAEPPPIAKLLARGVDLLICDESSKLKHTSSKRFKTLKPWLPRFARRWILTGSPAANHLLDVFGQVYVADLGRALGPYITHFRAQYFDPAGYMNYEWKAKPTAEKRIYKALKDVALSMSARDHLDLPDLVERQLWVDLPPAARKSYDDIEEDLITQLESGVVTAANAAVASGKCRQVASGGVYLDGVERRVEQIHEEKTDALVELVDELQGRPLLVSYEFNHDLERITNRLPDAPAINGKTSPKRLAELVSAWNAGQLPVLAGHPAAMGHGINLQAGGSHVCFYSLPWDFELYDQLIRRIWRQGQRGRVLVYHLLARETVDEVVARALVRKDRQQRALLDALRTYARAKSR